MDWSDTQDADILKQAALLTSTEMGQADRLTIDGRAGQPPVPSLELMERAGGWIFEALDTCCARGRVFVLTGPGNNGGDGFVAARLAQEAGWQVELMSLVPVEALRGDAAAVAGQWQGVIHQADTDLARDLLADCDAVIDAAFGAGLSRPLEGLAAEIITRINDSGAFVIAVDMPSGVDGTTGQVSGIAVEADLSVTFFRAKPGHVLLPGKALCGALIVRDIGIPETVLDHLHPAHLHNTPDLWLHAFAQEDWRKHKYDHGHAMVVSGGASRTGAARLGARATLRSGAGLVTVLSPPSAVLVNAMHLTAIMVRSFRGAPEAVDICRERKARGLLAGPALGTEDPQADLIEALLEARLPLVLDADALTIIAAAPERFMARLHDQVILTPHEGEFERLFPGLLADSAMRSDAVREAARRTGAVVLLKGPNTIVSDANGKLAAITDNAPPALATAGSGDVLAGIILGLLVQGMDPFLAANAGAWLHGDAASRFGRGLIAEDLPDLLPECLQDLPV